MPSISGCPSRITNTTADNRFFPQNLGDFFQRRFLLAAEEKRNSGCRKTMLQKKDNRAAGELEGAKAPLEIGLIAIKNA